MKESEQVQPIRLDGKSVLQFVEGFEPSRSTLTSRPALLNLPEILGGAGFTAEEIEFLDATRLDELTFAQLHSRLGWNASKVDRVRKSVARKLKGIPVGLDAAVIHMRHSGGDSIHLSYAQTVQTWDLATIPACVIREELSRARSKSIFISKLPDFESSGTRIEGRVRIMKMQLNDIARDLQVQKAKLAEVIERATAATIETSNAAEEYESLKAEAALDAELVILEERRADASLPKRLAAAEKRLADLRTRETAYDGALTRQQAKVSQIEDDIAARKGEAFRLDLGNASKEITALMRQLGEKAMSIESIARKHQQDGHALAAALFPFSSADPYSASAADRIQAIGLFNLALRFAAESRNIARAA